MFKRVMNYLLDKVIVFALYCKFDFEENEAKLAELILKQSEIDHGEREDTEDDRSKS